MSPRDQKRSEPIMAAPDRDRFIPIRKADILDALIDHGRIATGAVWASGMTKLSLQL
jgi:hypothetical protein